eukprot:Rhum_TRINITY_DN24813_c0_g1::Rhum_TRINITY_DN24813_c0_g1_i1::g.180183::m.180183
MGNRLVFGVSLLAFYQGKAYALRSASGGMCGAGEEWGKSGEGGGGLLCLREKTLLDGLNFCRHRSVRDDRRVQRDALTARLLSSGIGLKEVVLHLAHERARGAGRRGLGRQQLRDQRREDAVKQPRAGADHLRDSLLAHSDLHILRLRGKVAFVEQVHNGGSAVAHVLLQPLQRHGAVAQRNVRPVAVEPRPHVHEAMRLPHRGLDRQRRGVGTRQHHDVVPKVLAQHVRQVLDLDALCALRAVAADKQRGQRSGAVGCLAGDHGHHLADVGVTGAQDHAVTLLIGSELESLVGLVAARREG